MLKSKRGTTEYRLECVELQTKLYEMLSTTPMTFPEIMEAVGITKYQAHVFLRNMEEKGNIAKDLGYKITKYYANPNKPYEVPAYVADLKARQIRKQEKEEAIKNEEEANKGTQPFVEQVNAYTRIVRLTNNRLPNPAPRKKTKASKFVSMGSGMLMFSTWE